MIWVVSTILYALCIYGAKGTQDSSAFITSYLSELGLGLDNVFIFILLFQQFEVQEAHIDRLLIIGIFLAVILRGIVIIGGVFLIHSFTWIYTLLGLYLIYTAVKLWFDTMEVSNFTNNRLYRYVSYLLPVKPSSTTNRLTFFYKINNKIYATPLVVLIILIGIIDLTLAFDSISVVLSISTNTLIIYTSNILAVLCMRTLFYIFYRINKTKMLLSKGIACILAFTGLKLLLREQIASSPFFNNYENIIMIVVVLLCILVPCLMPSKSSRQTS
ncbi:MAG: hypothetical protein QM528_06165 [Phycisphaerales bacterium]|nr:hypothetical protein [Phycisphaerales bacterium]